MEFWIEVVRDPSTVPQRDGQTFVRLPTRAAAGAVFGPAGENIIGIGATDPIYNHVVDLYSGPGGFVDSVSGKFVAAVDNGWRAISPSDAAQLAAEPFRSLIGSSLSQSQSARDWIVPGDAFEPGDPIVASLLPLGFRPLADRYAGTASYFALCRYMYAVEMMIDAAPGLWSSTFTTAAAWRQWFALLSSRSQNLLTLVKAASALVVSTYVSTDPDLDQEVATLIGDWTGGTGGVAEAPTEILRLMLAKPSLFAELRALLLTRLRAPNKLPPDLLRVQSVRAIEPPKLLVGGATRLERSTLSLGDALLKDAGQTALGFVEVLGNEKYDFQFILNDFAVFGIEAFLKSPIPDPSVASHPLDGQVHVPSPKDAPRVELPSRQPLVSPAHLYTDNLSGMEQENWALQFITGADQLSISGLQDSRTVRKATSGEPALVLRAASSDFARSTQYDRVVIASLFYVVSDESNEFENDAFRFLQAVAPELIGFGTTTVPTPAVAALFKALESNSVLTSIDGLENALDDDTVQFVSKALTPPEPIANPASYPAIEVSDKNGSELAECAQRLCRFPVSSSPELKRGLPGTC